MRTEKQQFFKVVTATKTGARTKYTSVLSYNPYSIRYHVHRYVKARIGGLLVFNNYQCAVNFAQRWHNSSVWRVLVKKPISLPKYRADTAFMTASDIEDAWGKGRYATWYWPLHTQAFKYVRLEKRLA